MVVIHKVGDIVVDEKPLLVWPTSWPPIVNATALQYQTAAFQVVARLLQEEEQQQSKNPADKVPPLGLVPLVLPPGVLAEPSYACALAAFVDLASTDDEFRSTMRELPLPDWTSFFSHQRMRTGLLMIRYLRQFPPFAVFQEAELLMAYTTLFLHAFPLPSPEGCAAVFATIALTASHSCRPNLLPVIVYNHNDTDNKKGTINEAVAPRLVFRACKEIQVASNNDDNNTSKEGTKTAALTYSRLSLFEQCQSRENRSRLLLDQLIICHCVCCDNENKNQGGGTKDLTRQVRCPGCFSLLTHNGKIYTCSGPADKCGLQIFLSDRGTAVSCLQEEPFYQQNVQAFEKQRCKELDRSATFSSSSTSSAVAAPDTITPATVSCAAFRFLTPISFLDGFGPSSLGLLNRYLDFHEEEGGYGEHNHNVFLSFEKQLNLHGAQNMLTAEAREETAALFAARKNNAETKRQEEEENIVLFQASGLLQAMTEAERVLGGRHWVVGWSYFILACCYASTVERKERKEGKGKKDEGGEEGKVGKKEDEEDEDEVSSSELTQRAVRCGFKFLVWTEICLAEKEMEAVDKRREHEDALYGDGAEGEEGEIEKKERGRQEDCRKRRNDAFLTVLTGLWLAGLCRKVEWHPVSVALYKRYLHGLPFLIQAPDKQLTEKSTDVEDYLVLHSDRSSTLDETDHRSCCKETTAICCGAAEKTLAHFPLAVPIEWEASYGLYGGVSILPSICALCKAMKAPTSMFECPACRAVVYCSEHCRKNGWILHSCDCNPRQFGATKPSTKVL